MKYWPQIERAKTKGCISKYLDELFDDMVVSVPGSEVERGVGVEHGAVGRELAHHLRVSLQ